MKGTYPVIEKEYPYASFSSRAGARIIDLLFLLAVFNLFYLVDRFGAEGGLWPPSRWTDELAVPGEFSVANVLRGVFFFGFPIFYYVYLHGAYGQTFGKMAFRIRALNEDGSPMNYRRAFLRWLSYFLCDATLYFGYVWALFDKRNQGLHDKVCKTIVVQTHA